MLFSWLYRLPVEPAWNSKLKVISILMGMHIGVTKYCCFFVYETTTPARCYCGSLWKATFVHKTPICCWSEQCSGAQHPSLANHDKS